MSAFSRFSPAPVAADAAQQKANETADLPGVEEVTVEWGVNTSLDSHSTKRRSHMWLQRFWAGAGGASLCVTASLMTVAAMTAASGEPQSVVAIVGVPLFGAASICFMKLARQYGEGVLLAIERERQHLIEAAEFAGEFARLEAREAAEIANELARRLVEVKTAYHYDFRTYRAEVAPVPAEGEAGAEFSPSAEVLFMNPHKPKAVH